MKKNNKNKIGSAAVIFIMVIILGVLAYSNRGILRKDGGQSKTVLSFETGSHQRFENSGNNILALGKEGIDCISQAGEQLWSITKQLSSPVMQSEKDHILLFDRGGKDAAVYRGGERLWEITAQQPIITAKINQRGYTAIATYDVGYKGRIEIYNTHGELVYKWQLGDSYVVDIDVSPDCRYFAAVTVSSGQQQLASKLSVVNIDAERVEGEVEYPETLLITIKYQAGGNLVALGEDELIGISAGGQQKWAVEFEGRELQKFKLPYDSSCVLSFAGSRNNSIIQIYNRNGHKTGEYISEGEVKVVDVSGNSVAAAEDRSISVLNLKGRVSSKIQTQREIRSALLTQNGRVAVVYGNTVEIIKP